MDEMFENDIIEISDENGNTYSFEVCDYFFYNGEEYAVLKDAAQDNTEEDLSIVIMKVNLFTDENGEEMEEFVPIDDELMEVLTQIARTRILEGTDDAGDDEAE